MQAKQIQAVLEPILESDQGVRQEEDVIRDQLKARGIAENSPEGQAAGFAYIKQETPTYTI
jgi:hypothetical protein